MGPITPLTCVKEDPVKVVKELTGGVGADVVFDAAGVGSSLDDALNLSAQVVPSCWWLSMGHRSLLISIRPLSAMLLYTVRGEGRRNVRRSLSLAAQRKIDLRPLITHEFPMKGSIRLLTPLRSGLITL